jgi:adenylate cyclase
MSYPLSETQAAALRSPDYLENLRQQAQSVSQQTVLPGQPTTLWPVLSWNDLLNQAMGMQTTENSYLTRSYGQTWMHAKTKNGGLPVAYEELPYEWDAPHHSHVERIHSKGPLKYMRFAIDLRAVDPGHTEVTCSLHFVSILPTLIAKPLILKEIKAFIRLFTQLAERLEQGIPPLRTFFAPASSLATQWASQWESWVPWPAVRQALADYIAHAPERLAYRLRPFEVASAYHLDPLEVLKACLYLTREGLLHLRWDCRCPGCKGPKESAAQLQDLKAMAYCPTCASHYGLAFDQNIELTFQPAAALRPTQERYFCAGSPGNTPHLAWQQNFAPHQNREFTLQLAPGGYALRSLSSTNEVLIWLGDHPQAQAEARLTLSEHFDGASELYLQPGARLQLHNTNAYELTCMLENLDWQAEAVTAARVQAVQAFHDLFPEQILAPGEHLPLQSQILLHARIHNGERLSTSGDPVPELLAWLQQGIQAHEGAVVSQGDTALWGIFATPWEALSAAYELSQGLSDLNLLYDEPIVLQMALAAGACEVIAEHQQLQYRGGICEVLTAMTGTPDNSALWVSQNLWQDPLVQAELAPLMAGQTQGDWQYFNLQMAVV